MITQRQEKILQYLVEEYLNLAEPISSELLKEKGDLNVSPATIRNELQELTEKGYITQPHTSAGRVPTNKGYRYFIEITFTREEKLPDFIVREAEATKQKIDRELQLAQELIQSLSELSSVLNFSNAKMEEDTAFDILKIIGTSRTSYHKNIELMNELIKKLDLSPNKTIDRISGF